MPEPASVIISHWNHLIDDFNTSPKEYYTLVEEAIKKREIPDVKLSRIVWKEGGIMSAKREYLRVKRRDHIFDICGAPFGKGFFFSWWLGEKASGCLTFLLKIPIVGETIAQFFAPQTYYRIDTAMMFQKSVHAAVMDVIDALSEESGFKALSELERKPVMKDFTGAV